MTRQTGEPDSTQTVVVWDPLVRLFHWSLVVLFVTAYLSGEDGAESLHLPVGYLLLGLVTFRLVWGFVGSRYARFGSFLFSPSVTLDYLKEIARGHPRRYLGHNPAGAAMIFLLLGLLVATLISGLMVAAVIEFEGPLTNLLFTMDDSFAATVRTLHELCVDALLPCVAAHLVGVVLASRQHRENLALAMITGKKAQEGAIE